ncbi:pyridoxal phosphate-dependent aminotransferase [Fulvivirga sedimenti]|uniref:alanine transaminase n=1 Tax=Fulvivirga sedimenti TaxID=2879465 RepID=A0A9X1HR01_9BACT|nr:pyridoxal phosphate-dependent aminotransferase [Fulvivirga sedimenti]MCA6075561.1 pyridoxal phosphate-dependent aminotransferase [Fulvivirga sedimenti]MCA6076738.1 pyridoxal phosphate-dependent aminotransferase [Fulvivirga sedimenti]MCA6077866.1 pyridoxal phosphate-dependent aminotransferase [Fulvivirga sedimenti]
MRNRLVYEGASQLEYEIRQIVRKAEQIAALGIPITWENIGDPIQKHNTIPGWIKEIVSGLVMEDSSYGYCHSKGVPATREFLAKRNNALGGVQITAEDILFFNGLGDAISKLYQYLPPTSRIIGPSPAYSTHSSAEAAHANSAPLTYLLDPENSWYPDLEDLYNKVKFNPNISGILIINPDNPTGMIYPHEYLERIVSIAREFDLLLIADEIYSAITASGNQTELLSRIVGDRPAISMKGISKELPWPGSRCGWMEFYNRKKDPQFDGFCTALENAKMVEVCSTTLPQKAIPAIFTDSRYEDYLCTKNQAIASRGEILSNLFSNMPQIYFSPTRGAFYNTIIFNPAFLNGKQRLDVQNAAARELVESWVNPEMPPDRRFVYYLLAATGICVVPLSSFQSDLSGFRMTLLEQDEETFTTTFTRIREAIIEFTSEG